VAREVCLDDLLRAAQVRWRTEQDPACRSDRSPRPLATERRGVIDHALPPEDHITGPAAEHDAREAMPPRRPDGVRQVDSLIASLSPEGPRPVRNRPTQLPTNLGVTTGNGTVQVPSKLKPLAAPAAAALRDPAVQAVDFKPRATCPAGRHRPWGCRPRQPLFEFVRDVHVRVELIDDARACATTNASAAPPGGSRSRGAEHLPVPNFR
jgi:hypothetical protein